MAAGHFEWPDADRDFNTFKIVHSWRGMKVVRYEYALFIWFIVNKKDVNLL